MNKLEKELYGLELFNAYLSAMNKFLTNKVKYAQEELCRIEKKLQSEEAKYQS